MNDAHSDPAAPPRPLPTRYRIDTLVVALSDGWRLYVATFAVSSAYAALFAVFGYALIAALAHIGLSPMAWALIGGFLLVGPALLAGFFGIARGHRARGVAGPRDVIAGFRTAPAGLVGLSAVCLLLFVIWLTDAGILYSFMVGGTGKGWPDLLPHSAELLRFQLGTTVMGGFFAVIVFSVSAYSVPLLLERRAGLVVAVAASVRAVFGSPLASLAWSLSLGAGILLATLLPPSLIVVLPWFAYASEALYRRVFPT
ncbi:MAG: DUF2189 domain-containing protein [Rhodocyclaceae bacterium]